MLIALTSDCYVSATDITEIRALPDGSIAVHVCSGAIHRVAADRAGTQPTVSRLAREVNTLLKSKGSSQ